MAVPVQVLVNFDDLSTTGAGSPIPLGFDGFDWSAGSSPLWVITNSSSVALSGYEVLARQLGTTNSAFEPAINNQGDVAQPIDIHQVDLSLFEFNSVYITSAWDQAQAVTLIGYDNGQVVGTLTVLVNNQTPTFVSADWGPITDLKISNAETEGPPPNVTGDPKMIALADFSFTMLGPNPEFFNAASAVYQDNHGQSAGGPASTNGLLVLFDSRDSKTFPEDSRWWSDGFFAQAFLDKAGNVIIAFEGSVPGNASAYGFGAALDDVYIFSGGRQPPAFIDAGRFVSDVEQMLPSAHIYLTGHSLGGAEAEFVGLATGLPGVTFGAPGILPLGFPVNAQNFIDYVENRDPIGNFKSHYGSVEHIGPSGIVSLAYHQLLQYGHDLGLA
jgi:hypothetical protein